MRQQVLASATEARLRQVSQEHLLPPVVVGLDKRRMFGRRKKRTSLLLSASRVVTVRSSVVPEGKKDNKDGKSQVKKGTTRRKAAILGVGLFGTCQSAGLQC